MSNEAFDDELIDQYLDGRMNQKERRRFEEQMAQQPDLAEEVALHRDIREGIAMFEYHNLKEKLKQLDQHIISPPENHKSGNSRRLFTWIVVAASFATLMLLGYLLLEQSESPQMLVSAYYQAYPNVMNPVDRSSAIADNTLTEALHAYEVGEYQQAITLFEQNKEQMSEGHYFYLAMSYFEMDQTAQSIALLEQVIQKNDSLFYFPALWYQALAYLKTDQIPSAKDNLKTLAEEENSYQKEAVELLEKLE